MTKNLTLAIDENILEKARIIAAKRRTTVNAAVREFLTKFGSEEDRIAESRKRLRELIDNSSGRAGPDFRWDRDALYDE